MHKVVHVLRHLDLDFNDIFILECFKFKEDKQYLDLYQIPSLKDFTISTRFQNLKKLDYLVEDPNNNSELILSVKGASVLNSLNDAAQDDGLVTARIVMLDMRSNDQLFEEWWKAYPTTPAWTTDDKNTKFIGSRNLKNLRKPEAKKRYLKLLNQGLDHEDLMGSLRYEIKLRKVDSIKKGKNEMEYFKGMESYLNSERYISYIDLYKENPDFVKGEEDKVKSKKKNVIDI